MYKTFSGRSFPGSALSCLVHVRFFFGFIGFLSSYFFGALLLMNMFSLYNNISPKILALFFAISMFVLLIGPRLQCFILRVTARRGLRLRPELSRYISHKIINAKLQDNVESYGLDDPDPWVWGAVMRAGRS